MKLNLGRDSEARFGQDFEFYFIGDADVWLRSWYLVMILKMNLIKIYVWTSDMTSSSYFDKMNSTLGSVVPLAMFFLFSGRQNWISHNVGVMFLLFLLNPSTHPLIVQYWLFEKKCGSLQCIILFRDVIWRLRLESRFKVGDFMIQAPLEKSSWSSSAQTLHSRFYFTKPYSHITLAL